MLYCVSSSHSAWCETRDVGRRSLVPASSAATLTPTTSAPPALDPRVGAPHPPAPRAHTRRSSSRCSSEMCASSWMPRRRMSQLVSHSTRSAYGDSTSSSAGNSWGQPGVRGCTDHAHCCMPIVASHALTSWGFHSAAKAGAAPAATEAAALDARHRLLRPRC